MSIAICSNSMVSVSHNVKISSGTRQQIFLNRSDILDKYTNKGLHFDCTVNIDLNRLFNEFNLTGDTYDSINITNGRLFSQIIHALSTRLPDFHTTEDGPFAVSIKQKIEAIFNLNTDINMQKFQKEHISLNLMKVSAQISNYRGILYTKFLNEVQLDEICKSLRHSNIVNNTRFLSNQNVLNWVEGDTMVTLTDLYDEDTSSMSNVMHCITLNFIHTPGSWIEQGDITDYSVYIDDQIPGKNDGENTDWASDAPEPPLDGVKYEERYVYNNSRRYLRREYVVESEERVLSFDRHQEELRAPPIMPGTNPETGVVDKNSYFWRDVTHEPYKVLEYAFSITQNSITVQGPDGDVRYHALCFGGSIPGPCITAREGDWVELTMDNKTSAMLEFTHNIDFHASTGALGGGMMTKAAAGEVVVLRWRAMKSGSFLYHCAPGGHDIAFHMNTGMGGVCVVYPREGLRDRHGKIFIPDRSWYIGECDTYPETDITNVDDDSPISKKRKLRKIKDVDTGVVSISQQKNKMKHTMSGLVPGDVSFNLYNNDGEYMSSSYNYTANVGERVMVVSLVANRHTHLRMLGATRCMSWFGGKINNNPQLDNDVYFLQSGTGGMAVYDIDAPGVYVYSNTTIQGSCLGPVEIRISVEGKMLETMDEYKQPLELLKLTGNDDTTDILSAQNPSQSMLEYTIDAVEVEGLIKFTGAKVAIVRPGDYIRLKINNRSALKLYLQLPFLNGGLSSMEIDPDGSKEVESKCPIEGAYVIRCDPGMYNPKKYNNYEDLLKLTCLSFTVVVAKHSELDKPTMYINEGLVYDSYHDIQMDKVKRIEYTKHTTGDSNIASVSGTRIYHSSPYRDTTVKIEGLLLTSWIDGKTGCGCAHSPGPGCDCGCCVSPMKNLPVANIPSGSVGKMHILHTFTGETLYRSANHLDAYRGASMKFEVASDDSAIGEPPDQNSPLPVSPIQLATIPEMTQLDPSDSVTIRTFTFDVRPVMTSLGWSMDGGTQVWSYTFNGQAPGPFLVVNEGDWIRVKLKNTSNCVGEFEHSVYDKKNARTPGTLEWDEGKVRGTGSGLNNLGISFSNCNLPLGGARSLACDVGSDITEITFKAVKAGVWMYNACVPDNAEETMYATLSGLSGAIMVQPKGGMKAFGKQLPEINKTFVLGEMEFYVPYNLVETSDGNVVREWRSDFITIDTLKPYTLELMKSGSQPTHLCFNSHVPYIDPLKLDSQIRRGFFTHGLQDVLLWNVGDTISIINLVASRFSSPHLIGGHADLCFLNGSFDNHPTLDQESWYTCNGTATYATYTTSQPGQYVIVNHNLNEAFLLGAFGVGFADSVLRYDTSQDTYSVDLDNRKWKNTMMARISYYQSYIGTDGNTLQKDGRYPLPGFVQPYSADDVIDEGGGGSGGELDDSHQTDPNVGVLIYEGLPSNPRYLMAEDEFRTMNGKPIADICAELTGDIEILRDCVDVEHTNRVETSMAPVASDWNEDTKLEVVGASSVPFNKALTYKPIVYDGEIYALAVQDYKIDSADHLKRFYADHLKQVYIDEGKDYTLDDEITRLTDQINPYLGVDDIGGGIGWGHFAEIYVADPVSNKMTRSRYLHEIVHDVFPKDRRHEWVFYTSSRGPLYSTGDGNFLVTIQNPDCNAVVMFNHLLEGIAFVDLSIDRPVFTATNFITEKSSFFSALNRDKLGVKGMDPKGIVHIDTMVPLDKDGNVDVSTIGDKLLIGDSYTRAFFVSVSSMSQYCVFDLSNMNKKMTLNLQVPGSSWYNASGGIFRVDLNVKDNKVILKVGDKCSTCPSDYTKKMLLDDGIDKSSYIPLYGPSNNGDEDQYADVQYYIPLVNGLNLKGIEADPVFFLPDDTEIHECRAGFQYQLLDDTIGGTNYYKLMDHDLDVDIYLFISDKIDIPRKLFHDPVRKANVIDFKDYNGIVSFGGNKYNEYVLHKSTKLEVRYPVSDDSKRGVFDLTVSYTGIHKINPISNEKEYTYTLNDGELTTFDRDVYYKYTYEGETKSRYIEGKRIEGVSVVKTVPFQKRYDFKDSFTEWDATALNFYGVGVYTESTVYTTASGKRVLLSGGANGNYSPRSDEIYPAEATAMIINHLFSDDELTEDEKVDKRNLFEFLGLDDKQSYSSERVKGALYKADTTCNIKLGDEVIHKLDCTIRGLGVVSDQTYSKLKKWLIEKRATFRSRRGNRYLNGCSFIVDPTSMNLIGVVRGKYDDIDNRDHQYISSVVTDLKTRGLKDDGWNRDETGGNVIGKYDVFSGSKTCARVFGRDLLDVLVDSFFDVDTAKTYNPLWWDEYTNIENQQHYFGPNGVTIFSNCCYLGYNNGRDNFLYTTIHRKLYSCYKGDHDKDEMQFNWEASLDVTSSMSNGGSTVVNDVIYIPHINTIYAVNANNGLLLGECTPGDFGFGGGVVYCRNKLIAQSGFNKLGFKSSRPGNMMFSLQPVGIVTPKSVFSSIMHECEYYELPNVRSSNAALRDVTLLLTEELAEQFIQNERYDKIRIPLLCDDDGDGILSNMMKAGFPVIIVELDMVLDEDGKPTFNIDHPGGGTTITTKLASLKPSRTLPKALPKDGYFKTRLFSLKSWTTANSSHSENMLSGKVVGVCYFDVEFVEPDEIKSFSDYYTPSVPFASKLSKYSVVTDYNYRLGKGCLQHVDVGDEVFVIPSGTGTDAYQLVGSYGIMKSTGDWSYMYHKLFKPDSNNGDKMQPIEHFNYILQNIELGGDDKDPGKAVSTLRTKFPRYYDMKYTRGKTYILGKQLSTTTTSTTYDAMIFIYRQQDSGSIVPFVVCTPGVYENLQHEIEDYTIPGDSNDHHGGSDDHHGGSDDHHGGSDDHHGGSDDHHQDNDCSVNVYHDSDSKFIQFGDVSTTLYIPTYKYENVIRFHRNGDGVINVQFDGDSLPFRMNMSFEYEDDMIIISQNVNEFKYVKPTNGMSDVVNEGHVNLQVVSSDGYWKLYTFSSSSCKYKISTKELISKGFKLRFDVMTNSHGTYAYYDIPFDNTHVFDVGHHYFEAKNPATTSELDQICRTLELELNTPIVENDETGKTGSGLYSPLEQQSGKMSYMPQTIIAMDGDAIMFNFLQGGHNAVAWEWNGDTTEIQNDTVIDSRKDDEVVRSEMGESGPVKKWGLDSTFNKKTTTYVCRVFNDTDQVQIRHIVCQPHETFEHSSPTRVNRHPKNGFNTMMCSIVILPKDHRDDIFPMHSGTLASTAVKNRHFTVDQTPYVFNRINGEVTGLMGPNGKTRNSYAGCSMDEDNVYVCGYSNDYTGVMVANNRDTGKHVWTFDFQKSREKLNRAYLRGGLDDKNLGDDYKLGYTRCVPLISGDYIYVLEGKDGPNHFYNVPSDEQEWPLYQKYRNPNITLYVVRKDNGELLTFHQFSSLDFNVSDKDENDLVWSTWQNMVTQSPKMIELRNGKKLLLCGQSSNNSWAMYRDPSYYVKEGGVTKKTGVVQDDYIGAKSPYQLGLNLGEGMKMSACGVYFALDVTDPATPTVEWVQSSCPSQLKVGNKVPDSAIPKSGFLLIRTHSEYGITAIPDKARPGTDFIQGTEFSIQEDDIVKGACLPALPLDIFDIDDKLEAFVRC